MIKRNEGLTLVESRTGKSSLKVTCENNSLKSLHSLYDPEEEARALVSTFAFDGTGVLVVLGLGLGYHVAELARKYKSAHIMVIESEQEICNLAREHGPALNDRIEIITAQLSPDVLQAISRRQLQMGLAPLSVFTLASAVSAFPDYYRPLMAALRKTVSVSLWDRIRYSKFQHEKVSCLLIDSGYFLVREVEKAMQSMNHDVVRVSLRKERGSNDHLSELIQTIVEHRPDFVLTMNHLGFDEKGVLTSFLESIDMPAASWYVDSPKLILKAHNRNVSPFVSLFLWDSSYMTEMKKMGFDDVKYLPMGTDERVFRPVTKQRLKMRKYECNTGFVGNSMTGPVQEWMEKNRKTLHPVIEKVAETIISRNLPFEKAVKLVQNPDLQDLQSFSSKEMAEFEGAVLWKVTLLYRLSCIESFEESGITIHGDRGWKHLIRSDSITLKPPLNYYKELPLFYNACKINFNATSLQMREAVNQRVFDVPACGAFLLTDQQKSLNELFDVGNEIITYSDTDELPELADFYLRNPERRQAIATRGRERVLQDHTYRKRLTVMIEAMKKRYK
ncbi:MAG: glycosyltransferase [Nitrospiraceae bacterium]|nr:MAG: glycosyltransferase [Nitrospiraceae bacterium]